jgi:hypothetical protein
VDEAVREVLPEAELASDREKKGGYLHAAGYKRLATFPHVPNCATKRKFSIHSRHKLEHATFYRRTWNNISNLKEHVFDV